MKETLGLYEIVKDIWSWIATRVRRASLEISFDPSITCEKLQVVDADFRPACFYHLSVENTSRFAADTCRGILRQVTPVGAGPQNQHWLRKPEVLKWANESTYDAITIGPHEKRRLDLLYVFEDDPQIDFFFSEPDPPVGNPPQYPPGRYEVTVRIICHNARSVDYSFILVCEGNWDEVTIQPIGEHAT